MNEDRFEDIRLVFDNGPRRGNAVDLTNFRHSGESRNPGK